MHTSIHSLPSLLGLWSKDNCSTAPFFEAIDLESPTLPYVQFESNLLTLP